MAADMGGWSMGQAFDVPAEEKTDSSLSKRDSSSSSENSAGETSSGDASSKDSEQHSKGNDKVVASMKKVTSFQEAHEPVAAQSRVEVENKVNPHEIAADEAVVKFASVDDTRLREVLDLGGVKDLANRMSREVAHGRFEAGPSLSLSEVTFGDVMASNGLDESRHRVARQDERDIGFEMLAMADAAEHCQKKEPDYNTATQREVSEYLYSRDRCELAAEILRGDEGSITNPSPTPVPAETSTWDEICDFFSELGDDIADAAEDFLDWLFDRPAPEDMQGNHPLPADLLAGLAVATAQAYQDLYTLHQVGDGRNPEYNPEAACGLQAYSRHDLEDAVSLGGGGGCGQSDEGNTVDPDSLRRTFTLSNTIEEGCQGPYDLF